MSRKKKLNRRARGTGSIFYHEGRGQWVGRKPVGKTASGKTRYVERWGATQKEVIAKLDAVGEPGAADTFGGWAARWLKTLDVRESTLESYRQSVQVHCAPLAAARLDRVTASQVDALLVQLGKDQSPGSVAKIRSHGRTCYEAALRDGLAASNPFKLSRRPKRVKKQVDPFTPAELHAIIGQWGTLSAGPLLALLAATGCRLGEASALDATDWSPATGKIAITKSWSKKFGMGPPKSKNGTRTITVPEVCRPALDRAAGGRKSGPLFATRNGNRFIKTMVQAAFARLLVRLGFRRRRVHDLRHGVATALISAGHPIGDTAVYLGDSKEVVVATYLHESGRDAGVTLGDIFGRLPGPAPL